MAEAVESTPKAIVPQGSSKILNYSLRPGKNIERKMMGEVFARLAPIRSLSEYRYIGFGSEFFNDFRLYHQTLGIENMISIERDDRRIKRCKFNKPFRTIKVLHGEASDVLPSLSWKKPTIIWLDYTEKLNRKLLEDAKLLVSQVMSGSMLIWSFNAHPWSGERDDETNEKVMASDWPTKRLQKLRDLFGNKRKFDDVNGADLTFWGLAKVFHSVLDDEIKRTLNDRNDGTQEAEQITYRQCFHFRYADGARMLTIGGVFLNAADAAKMGDDPFEGLSFVRSGADSKEINPPTLTSREVRHLKRLLPNAKKGALKADWLSEDELESFRDLYRHYPIFAESEL